MVSTRRSSCSIETTLTLRRYELYIVNTRQRMMRLCRVVEASVRAGELPFEKAERHYLCRIRAVNKMAYHYLNLSRMTRHGIYDNHFPRVYNGSLEHRKITKILGMFNTLSNMMFRIIKRVRVNFDTDN